MAEPCLRVYVRCGRLCIRDLDHRWCADRWSGQVFGDLWGHLPSRRRGGRLVMVEIGIRGVDRGRPGGMEGHLVVRHRTAGIVASNTARAMARSRAHV